MFLDVVGFVIDIQFHQLVKLESYIIKKRTVDQRIEITTRNLSCMRRGLHWTQLQQSSQDAEVPHSFICGSCLLPKQLMISDLQPVKSSHALVKRNQMNGIISVAPRQNTIKSIS